MDATVFKVELERIQAAHAAVRLRKYGDKERPPVEFRYFNASADYEEKEGEPKQLFFCVDQERMRKIMNGNILALVQSRNKVAKGPQVDGWYVQSRSADGSRLWHWLGATAEAVEEFFGTL